ncbi:MAG: glycosyltransferase [Candidatus Omnitrophota bacterium]
MLISIEVDIIILSYQNLEYIKDCLDSVLKSTHSNIRIYIVDNNSSAVIIDEIRRRYAGLPQVILMENKQNLGFAEGNNTALRRVKGKYSVILNNDTVVEPNWLEPMLRIMESDDRIGACQPKILNLRDKSKFDYSGAAGGFIDRFGYPFLRGRILDTIEDDHGQYDDNADLDWCSGAAFMVRNSILKQIGLFDPIFFMYGEENDLCWRIKKCGHRMVFCHNSIVYHAGMASSRKRPLFKLHLNYRNGLIVLLKNLAPAQLLTVLPARIFLDFVNIVYFLMFKFSKFPYFSILWAYAELTLLIPKVINSRKQTQNLYKCLGVCAVRYETYEISVIYQYFILGRKTFGQLKLGKDKTDKMEEIINKISDTKRWIDSNKILPDFKNNNEYMNFAVEIGNHIRYLMIVSASLVSEKRDGYDKINAVIVGLFVRLYKLYDTLCFHIAENHGEIVQIFMRLIFETSITIEYLISKGKDSINNFIFISYKATKENYEDLQFKKSQRDLIPIEKRILNKIERQIKEDGINLEKLLKNKNWKLDNKSFKDILKELNIEDGYSYTFGSGSSYVHGDWKDIRANHLKYEDNLYYPQIDHDIPDPRYICPLSIVCLRTLILFLKWNDSDPNKVIIETAEKLSGLVRNLDNKHEKDLQC